MVGFYGLSVARMSIESMAELIGCSIVAKQDAGGDFGTGNGAVDAAKKDITLSPEQNGIAESVIADYDAGVRKTYLIHGITGSGKTEVA